MSNVTCLSLCCATALLAGCSSSPKHASGPRHTADASTVKPDASKPAQDSGAPATSDAGAPDAAISDASTDASTDAGRPDAADAAPLPPTNESFETAAALPINGQVMQRLLSATQADFYKFEAVAGGYYELTTDDTPISPDNRITLYDSQQQQIAQNDSGSLWPGDAIDARLVVRLKTAGTYYARVEDPNISPDDFDSPYAPALTYRLTLAKLEHDTPGYAFESGSGEPAAAEFVQDLGSGNWHVTLLGELPDKGNDLFGFQGRDQKALIGELLDDGVDGDGSTSGPLTVGVIAQANKQVLARIDHAKGQANIHPPVSAAAHQLSVTANDKTGDNGFYAINLVMLQDNPVELHDDTNGQLSAAEPIAMQGPFRRRGLLLSLLPPKDVDYYSFQADMGEHVTVACESESGGSGVRGLRAELRDAQDKVLFSQMETPLENLLIDGVTVPTSGMQYVRLSSDTKDGPDPVEPWVRCVVLAGP
jgi:Bacterial pre-peptidase C-terminal domain